MALRIIVRDPDPVLRETARIVTKFNGSLHKLLTDMAETMYEAEGVGLAAPQVGISKRVIVVDVGDQHGLVEMINPEMIETFGEQLGTEGCLSIPNVSGDVLRYQKIRVTAQDRNGQPLDYTAEGFFARAIQHEIDHLNGVLFTDHAKIIHPVDPDRLRSRRRLGER